MSGHEPTDGGDMSPNDQADGFHLPLKRFSRKSCPLFAPMQLPLDRRPSTPGSLRPSHKYTWVSIHSSSDSEREYQGSQEL